MKRRTSPAILKRMGGFSLVSAIFLIVLLAGLGAAILRISTAQQSGSALDIEGARAHLAARAGLEWGLHRVVNSPAACAAMPGSFTPNAAIAPAISQFRVTVTCTGFTSGGVTVYQLQSTACNQPVGAPGTCPGTGGTAFYVERQIQAVIGG